MKPFMTVNTFTDANGVITRVSRGDDLPPSMLFLPQAPLNSEVFGPSVKALAQAASNFAAVATAKIGDLSELGWNKEAAMHLRAALRNPYRLVRDRAIERSQELAQSRTKWLTERKVDPFRASEIRTYLRSLPTSAVIEAALTDPEIAAAVVGSWNLAGLAELPADTREAIEDALIAANLRDIVAPVDLKPSTTDLLAHGPDVEANARIGDEWRKKRNANLDEIGLVRNALNTVIAFTAAAGAMSSNDAFELLNADA